MKVKEFIDRELPDLDIKYITPKKLNFELTRTMFLSLLVQLSTLRALFPEQNTHVLSLMSKSINLLGEPIRFRQSPKKKQLHSPEH